MDKENTKSKKNKDEITSNIASYICWGILIAFMIWATIKLKQIENTRQIVEICNGNPETQFEIRQTTTRPEKIRKTIYGKHKVYKFTKQGNKYTEKNKYRKDGKNEMLNQIFWNR